MIFRTYTSSTTLDAPTLCLISRHMVNEMGGIPVPEDKWIGRMRLRLGLPLEHLVT